MVAAPTDIDSRVRLAAFAFLDAQRARYRDIVPREILARGFDFEGSRVPLVGPQGIFRPAVLPEIPLTITTAPEVEGKPRPYDDGINQDGLLEYRYRGTDPMHRENVGLRLAMTRGIPLVYLFGVVPGRYIPVYPVFIVDDHPQRLSFSVAVDDRRAVSVEGKLEYLLREDHDEARRRYITVATQVRLHQRSFRERVLHAYRRVCAICRLRHTELLDAAHILPDGHPQGLPVVPNGLALCSLHHAAFDAYILGVTPDYEVRVRTDVLEEADGPMLEHGLQGFEGTKLHVPASPELRPNREFLAERYELFRKAG